MKTVMVYGLLDYIDADIVHDGSCQSTISWPFVFICKFHAREHGTLWPQLRTVEADLQQTGVSLLLPTRHASCCLSLFFALDTIK